MKQKFPKYAVLEKIIGETPLQAAERLRKKLSLPADISLAYAGRLDPMASGKLLILIGEECKKQTEYHNLDKTYEVEILLGVSSDSGDVLGLLTLGNQQIVTEEEVLAVFENIPRNITLPYPHFSAKTVRGKPLHTWTLEGKLNEIAIPEKTSTIYKTSFEGIRTIPKEEVMRVASDKIERIPEVTDISKKLGADFRRQDVRQSWKHFEESGHGFYQVLTFSCTASSGTYMRSLSEYISEKLETTGLAYSIHRKTIGKYVSISKNFGFWSKRF